MPASAADHVADAASVGHRCWQHRPRRLRRGQSLGIAVGGKRRLKGRRNDRASGWQNLWRLGRADFGADAAGATGGAAASDVPTLRQRRLGQLLLLGEELAILLVCRIGEQANRLVEMCSSLGVIAAGE